MQQEATAWAAMLWPSGTSQRRHEHTPSEEEIVIGPSLTHDRVRERPTQGRVSQTPNVDNLTLGVLLGTEIATIVASAGWVIRASPPATPAPAGMQTALTPSPRRFRTCAGEVIGLEQ